MKINVQSEKPKIYLLFQSNFQTCGYRLELGPCTGVKHKHVNIYKFQPMDKQRHIQPIFLNFLSLLCINFSSKSSTIYG